MFCSVQFYFLFIMLRHNFRSQKPFGSFALEMQQRILLNDLSYRCDMDAIIKQAVRDELRSGSIDDLESSTRLSNETNRGQRTALLTKIRQGKGQTASKKRKLRPTCNKEHRIQIRWLNWKGGGYMTSNMTTIYYVTGNLKIS